MPHDGRPVTLFASQDERQSRQHALVGCMKHEEPGTVPNYPMTDMRAERQGVVVLRASFADAQAAPSIEVLDNGGGGWLAKSASEFARGYRLPCHDSAGVASFVQFYIFRIEGGARVVLKDVPFLTLLSGFKGIRQANVYFDFNTMACPFDLRFEPLQPVLPNRVGEIGEPNQERRFVLDWLTRQQLDLPKAQLNALRGQATVVTVPCTVLNLGARTGGAASQ